jgi:predicted RNA binding protein YcfA (HicA-like mRNA interferase family)
VRVGASGSHQKWRHPLTGKQVIVAQHRGQVLREVEDSVR